MKSTLINEVNLLKFSTFWGFIHNLVKVLFCILTWWVVCGIIPLRNLFEVVEKMALLSRLKNNKNKERCVIPPELQMEIKKADILIEEAYALEFLKCINFILADSNFNEETNKYYQKSALFHSFFPFRFIKFLFSD